MLKRIVFILFLLLAFKLYGQHYNVIRYGVREGLLHSFVSDLTQDSRGNIWIATGAGLCQFNGVLFNHFTTKEGLNSTRLTCIATDKIGNIWIGSARGINLFNGERVFSLVDPTLGETILAIKAIEGSRVWVATDLGLSLVSFENDTFDFERISYDFNAPELAMIFQDRSLTSFLLPTKSGELFYGSNGFLFRIGNKTIERIPIENGVRINSGTELPNGTLLFASNKGIVRLDGEKLSTFVNKHTNNLYLTQIQYHAEKIWMLGRLDSSADEEMYLFAIDLNDSTYFRKIGKKNGLIESPTSLFIDHENNIWTGSNGGLSILRGETFITYTKDDGLVGNKIWAIHQSSDNRLWIGTIGEGLSVISDGKVRNYNITNGLPDLYVGKVYEDSKGSTYLGTGNAGICRVSLDQNIDRINVTRFQKPFNAERVRVDDIIRDSLNVLWVASQQGLFYSNNDFNLVHFPLFEGDTGQVFVQKILIDSIRRCMWIATRNNGLFSISERVSTRFNGVDSDEEITTISQDSNGDIWVGTRTKGVFRIVESIVESYTVHNGLASNLIYILFPDTYGNLWVGTNLGLDKLNLNNIGEGRVEFRHYSTDDGLLDLETNLSGAFEDNNGFVWFATNGGLVRYDYKYDVSNRIPPKVNILALKLHSQKIDWKQFSDKVDKWNGLPEKLTLKNYQNHLTFEFVAISFKNPKAIQYSWLLEGFDQTWVNGGANRQAIYSNLPPGQYLFKLKAANNDGVWSDELQALEFIILPPIWETWWFRLMLLILFFLLLYLYLIWRTKTFKIRQKELQSIVDLRTSELTEQLKLIDKKNHQILDSISYAEVLQNAILPSISNIYNVFTDALVLYKPKDVVSGDFYWFKNDGSKSIIAVADCTGHGVPGAIVSVVCSNALNQAVSSSDIYDPAQILELTRKFVIDTFSRGYQEVRDGMDIALVVFDHHTNQLTFAGANSGLFAIVGNDSVKLKPNIQHIGQNLKTIPFTNQNLKLQAGDLFFMYTDGFTDQLGGSSRQKFSSKRLDDILFNNAHLNFIELNTILEETIQEWKEENEQTDDILVLGIRV